MIEWLLYSFFTFFLIKMFTLLSEQIFLWLSEKQVCIVPDWYNTALYNVMEYIKDIGNEEYIITKTENKFVIERWDNTITQERIAWDVRE